LNELGADDEGFNKAGARGINVKSPGMDGPDLLVNLEVGGG
jgi:hypothetical protein